MIDSPFPECAVPTSPDTFDDSYFIDPEMRCGFTIAYLIMLAVFAVVWIGLSVLFAINNWCCKRKAKLGVGR